MLRDARLGQDSNASKATVLTLAEWRLTPDLTGRKHLRQSPIYTIFSKRNSRQTVTPKERNGPDGRHACRNSDRHQSSVKVKPADGL
jgi:hypothetical protein